jgi:hypothetical protein
MLEVNHSDTNPIARPNEINTTLLRKESVVRSMLMRFHLPFMMRRPRGLPYFLSVSFEASISR